MKIKLLLSLISLGLLSSCNTVATHLPATRFESPEVPGHVKWRLAGGVGSSNTVNYSDDASSRPPVINEKLDTYLEAPILKGTLGLSDYFEISTKYGFPGAFIVKGKVQLLGAPAVSAKEGNLSVALTLGVGVDSIHRGGNQNGTFGPGGYNWLATSVTNITDYSLIVGYRPNDHQLIFVSPFAVAYKLEGKIHDDLSDNGTSPAADYTLSGTGSAYGIGFGFQTYFGRRKNLSVIVDLTAQKLEWSNTPGRESLGGGALFEVML